MAIRMPVQESSRRARYGRRSSGAQNEITRPPPPAQKALRMSRTRKISTSEWGKPHSVSLLYQREYMPMSVAAYFCSPFSLFLVPRWPRSDPGYEGYRGWGDPQAEVFRIIAGDGVDGSYTLTCLNTRTNTSVDSGRVDRGYASGASWVDINADGKTDYCRLILIGGDSTPILACNLATGSGFTATFESKVFSDAGYHTVRGWFGGSKQSLYCRGSGVASVRRSRAKPAK